MPKIVTPLTDTKIKNLKAKEKGYKIADGNGLFISVDAKGNKRWRFDYSFLGKRNSISFGVYPEVGLKVAREKREESKEKILKGVNPSLKSGSLKDINNFENITREYIDLRSELSEDYKEKVYRLMELNIIPYFKDTDINTIKPLEMLSIIKKMEDRGANETAHRVFSLLDRIYKYSVMVGKCEHNIMADLDKKIALKKVNSENFSHVTSDEDLEDILKSISVYRGSVFTKVALKITPYLFVRPFNIRAAEWEEFDFENKMWTIPAQKMKTGKAHLVPLSDTVIEHIKELEPFRTSKYLFVSQANKDRPMSDNTINQALKRLDLKDVIVAHGFRHTASTLLHENIHRHKVHSDAIEAQLAHTVSGVKGVYNKAIYIEERVRLMLWWSEHLDSLLAKKS